MRNELKALREQRRKLAKESGLLMAQRRLEAGIVRALLDRNLPSAPIPFEIEPAPLPGGLSLTPEILSTLYQDFLDVHLAPVGGRRRRGSFYTPASLVERILDELPPCPTSVLDPACGAGAFLSGMLARLIGQGIPAREALSRVCGGELDPHAAELCRIRLALEALERIAGPTPADWQALMEIAARNIRTGEALLELEWEGGFDLIVGNPPFLSAREMARAGMGEYRQRLAKRYRSARGAFDLSAVFVERAVELLQPGGRLGLVVPHKLFAAEYGVPLRELLSESCPERRVLDLSHESHFPGAAAYPQILLASKGPLDVSGHPCPETECHSERGEESWSKAGATPKAIPRGARNDGSSCFGTGVSRNIGMVLEQIESRSHPLGLLARIRCGTAGFNAARLASALVDGRPDSPAWPFLVTGSIDRYRLLPGPVRFQHRRYERPHLKDDPETVTAGQRALFSSPKIVVAGMVRRLEAAYDSIGHALGINVYGITSLEDPLFLLVVLNSAIASFYYRQRFAEKHLADDFMAINKGTLSQLPMPQASPELARRLSELGADPDDAEIDRLLFDFYELDEPTRRLILENLPTK